MSEELTSPDPWRELRRSTPARIALGRTGSSLGTSECLRFAAAHAQARDAVHLPLDAEQLASELQSEQDGLPSITVRSQAATRDIYLRRPDLGRRLDPNCMAALQTGQGPVDLAIILADGLSAAALHRHACPLLRHLRAALPAAAWTLAPLIIATQARVALGDEIGALLQARMALVLIGERPGLSSPDSLGAYLTFAPAPGRSDAERNCVSNIRPEGLPPEQAAQRIAWLLGEALRRGTSGIALKDESAAARLE